MKPPFKYLFVDDRWIAETCGVYRKPGAFEKHPHNPILVPDQPWEGHSIYCFGTAIEDAGCLRLWYQVYNEAESNKQFRSAVGYAESEDGLHWRKPLVGAHHPDHGPTNLVVLSSGTATLYSPSVIRDDADPDPARRYKMMIWDAMSADELAALGSPFPTCPTVPGWRGIPGEGLFVLTSPDGIGWTRKPQPVIGSPSDAAAMTQLDGGTYLATFKTSVREDRHFRVIAESRSDDFEHWTDPEIVLQPDWRDPNGTEFYGLSPFDYFGNRLGLLWIYHNAPDDKRMDVQLAAWSEETGWQRAADRATLLATGSSGAWDAGCVLAPSRPLWKTSDHGGLSLPYGGINVRHDDTRYRRDCIGRATLRRDGFVAMEAGHFPGTLLTNPIYPQQRLHINGDARHGTISVTCRSLQSGAIIAKTETISGHGSIDLPLEWIGEPPPTEAGPVRLEFSLQRAALYAFWFEA